MLAIVHADYGIRRALPGEQEAICTLVRSERLNPHHLYFENFAVAVKGTNSSARPRSVAIPTDRARAGLGRRRAPVAAQRHLGRDHRLAPREREGHDQRQKHAGHYARWGFAPIAARAALADIRFNYRVGSFFGAVMALLQRRPINRLTILRRTAEENG